MNLITLLFVVFLLGPSLSKGRRGGRLSKAEQSIGSSVRHRCSILNLDQLYHHPTQAWPSHQQEGHQLQLGGGERHFPLENRHQSELGLKIRLRSSEFCFQPPSYFFGTIHVPYTRVWDAVSTNTKKAFHATDRVHQF